MKGLIPEDAAKVFSSRLFSVYHKEQEQFDGTKKTFEWVRAYDTAKALCVVDGKILILETEMPGGLHFRTLPGGMLDEGEDFDAAIRREVAEETGITFSEFEHIHTVRSNVSLVESYRHYYIAKNPVSFGEQHLDKGGEKIALEYIGFDEMIDLVKKNEVFSTLGDRIVRNYILPGKEEELKKILFG